MSSDPSQKELEEWFMCIEDDDKEVVSEKLEKNKKLLGYYFENAVFDDEFSGLSSELLGNKVGPLNPIQYACFVESEEAALLLADSMTLDKLGEKWGNGNTVLHLASLNGMNRLVAKLIEKGVNPVLKNKQGYRPMDCVADELTREAFAQKEGDPLPSQSPQPSREERRRQKEEEEEEEEGDESFEYVYPDNPPKRLIDLKAKPLKTILKKAQSSTKKTVKKITFDQRTTFFDCVRNGELQEVSQYINSKKFDSNTIYSTGITVLHLAVESGNIELVKFLIEKGAKVDAKDDDSWTPLHLASLYGYRDIIVFLLSKGASKDSLNLDNEKPADVAEDPEVQKFLKGSLNNLDISKSTVNKKTKMVEVKKETFRQNSKILSQKE